MYIDSQVTIKLYKNDKEIIRAIIIVPLSLCLTSSTLT